MRGTTHAMSGAAAGTAVGLLAPSPALSVACVAVAAVAALGPDIDHPRSHASKSLGPITWVLCRIVRGMSRLLGLPAHRGLSHTTAAAGFAGVAVVGGLLAADMSVLARLFVGVGGVLLLARVRVRAALLLLLVGGGLSITDAPVLVALLLGGAAASGWLTALAGDWVTKTSLPHLWWPFIAESHGPPRFLRITTGKWVESVIMWLVFVPATCFGLYLILLR